MAKVEYLVTGGAGFIGSHLVEALLERGNGVRVLDNFSSGSRTNVNPSATVIEGDVRRPDDVAAACRGARGIFHLAAIPQVQQSIEQPAETNEVNLSGTINVLVAAAAAGVRRIVYSSSSAVYGQATALPTDETTPPNPINPYAVQKYASERYLGLGPSLWGVETVCLRYFNVFGPRMPATGAYASVLSVFLRERRAGRPLPITGDGAQTRDFIYVGDVAAANLLAMDRSSVGRGEVINIGSGQRRSVNEIAALIGGPTVNLPPRVEVRDSEANIVRAARDLGWAPQHEFPDALRTTMAERP